MTQSLENAPLVPISVIVFVFIQAFSHVAPKDNSLYNLHETMEPL